jgi:hypothetical protein
MSDQSDPEADNDPVTKDPASTGIELTEATPDVPVTPKPIFAPGGWVPGPSGSLPSGGTPPSKAGGPPQAGWWTPTPRSSAAPRPRRWRIGLAVATITATVAAGTLIGHAIWPARAANTSPAGTSSPIGPGSGGSNGGAINPPTNGSGSARNPSGQYPDGSSGANSGSNRPTGGSDGSLIPTKRYPGSSGGSDSGSNQFPSGSNGLLNPSSQYPDGAGGQPPSSGG